jgi:hypothetical protein
LWRIRRATSIETGLLRIQAEILRARCHAPRNSSNGSGEDYRTNGVEQKSEELAVSSDDAVSAWRELTYCFLRLANLDNGAFDRIGRYEVHLWRQIAQTLFALQTIQTLLGYRRRSRCHRAEGDQGRP